MNVSIICACKDRYEALLLSLNSWLFFDEIKEIIIVDWSSNKSFNHLTELDERIKIIRVENKKYFNLSQPLNLAASQATGDYILKFDADYILNPYFNFFETYQIDEYSFLSGNHNIRTIEYQDMSNFTIEEIRDYVNSYNYFFKFLKGMLYISKSNFNRIGGYDEDIQNYGWEDNDIISRLEQLNLEHKKLAYDHHLIHLPHSDRKRFENSPQYSSKLEEDIKNNLSSFYSGNELQWETDYSITQNLINHNKLFSKTYHYVKPITEWSISKIDDQYLIAEQVIHSKLKGFPSVYYTTLEESVDRQKSLEQKFGFYGITNIHSIVSKRFAECDDKVEGKYIHQLNDGTKGCCVSHLKAIKDWYETTNEDYGFFCEDDLSLETIQYWNFTWQQMIEKLPDDWDCIQLLSIRSDFDSISIREREWNDWAVTAYILTRDYARKIIDTYIQDDVYRLELPDSEVMPLIENIIYSIGKTYVYPIFVEDMSFNSTYVGMDDDVKDGQKNNHKVAHDLVLNLWKKKSMPKGFVIKTSKSKTTLEALLTEYALDTENPERNFAMGMEYEKQGHNAPALSYFLRCAERTDNDVFAYEALIHGSNCYDRQGTRDGTAKGILQQALCLLPQRPEAYFLLSRFSERKEWWQDAYIYADTGLRTCNFESEELKTDVEYPGRYGLLFLKAVSAWWWGKTEESKSIFMDLKENHTMNSFYSQLVNNNLTRF